MIDTWPPLLRHLLFAVAPVALAWLGTDLVPYLKGQPGYGALAGIAVTMLIAYLTPLVKQYGPSGTPVVVNTGNAPAAPVVVTTS